MPRLTTGSKNLDRLLCGGLEPGITELIGAYGTGKTQICLQACLTVQLTPNRGGLDGAAFYIDTEDTFKPERLEEIARGIGLEDDRALDRVFGFRAINSDHQFEGLRLAQDYVRERGVKVLYRWTRSPPTSGTNTKAGRTLSRGSRGSTRSYTSCRG